MKSPDKETLKGTLLDRWMEDLGQDRAPSLLPEMQQLSPQEIADTLALARSLTAMSPVSPTTSEVTNVAATVYARIHREDEQQQQALATAVGQATSFGDLLGVAREVRQLKPAVIERSLKLPAGTLAHLEGATISPHRIPMDSMLALLRSLRIASGEIVELIRQAGVEWASTVYTRPAAQFGRVGAELDVEARGRVLAEATSYEDHEADLTEELERVERYCRSLAIRVR